MAHAALTPALTVLDPIAAKISAAVPSRSNQDAQTTAWSTPVRCIERRMYTGGLLKMADGERITHWGFDDPLHPGRRAALPSPLIRVNEGEGVHIKLEMMGASSVKNNSATAHNIGRASAGSVAVARTENFVYQWKPRKAGTWLYQHHASTPLDFEMGLYGVLVVDAERDSNGRTLAYHQGPAYDCERFWVFDDIDPSWHGSDAAACTPSAIAANGGFNPHLFYPKYFLVNGIANTEAVRHPDVAVQARAGEKVLLRLVNASYSLMRVRFEKLRGHIVSVDGSALDVAERPWTQWIAVEPDQPVFMATGSRNDVLIDLDPAKNNVQPGDSFQVVFEFLDPARRAVRNIWAAHTAHTGRAVTTISIV
jgi:FtsP/CotA-like multicopper oxidase with cupredoxin domain